MGSALSTVKFTTLLNPSRPHQTVSQQHHSTSSTQVNQPQDPNQTQTSTQLQAQAQPLPSSSTLLSASKSMDNLQRTGETRAHTDNPSEYDLFSINMRMTQSLDDVQQSQDSKYDLSSVNIRMALDEIQRQPLDDINTSNDQASPTDAHHVRVDSAQDNFSLLKFEPGDLVFFYRGQYHHVAIYAGDDQVIHLWNAKGQPEIGLFEGQYNEDLPQQYHRIHSTATATGSPTTSEYSIQPMADIQGPLDDEQNRNKDNRQNNQSGFRIQITNIADVIQGAVIYNATKEYDSYMLQAHNRRPVHHVIHKLTHGVTDDPDHAPSSSSHIPSISSPSGALVVQRAKNYLGNSRYNVLRWNCEHFATWARYDLATCQQVKKHTTDVLKAGRKGLRYAGIPGMLIGMALSGFVKVWGKDGLPGVSAASIDWIHRESKEDIPPPPGSTLASPPPVSPSGSTQKKRRWLSEYFNPIYTTGSNDSSNKKSWFPELFYASTFSLAAGASKRILPPQAVAFNLVAEPLAHLGLKASVASVDASCDKNEPDQFVYSQPPQSDPSLTRRFTQWITKGCLTSVGTSAVVSVKCTGNTSDDEHDQLVDPFDPTHDVSQDHDQMQIQLYPHSRNQDLVIDDIHLDYPLNVNTNTNVRQRKLSKALVHN